MRIKHSIVRNGCTLSGQILETVFEEGEKRGDSKSRYSKDENFQVISYEIPELYRSTLYVWGRKEGQDDYQLSFCYNSEQEAQKVLDYINEFTVQKVVKEPKESDIIPAGTMVWVSDKSLRDTEIRKSESILIVDLGNKYNYRYIVESELNEKNWIAWQYAVPVPPAPQKTKREVMMTDEEYEAFILKN